MSRCERALRALTAGNRTLLRATDEQQLLQDMCRVIVETAGYATAWVGYAEHDPQKSIRVMGLPRLRRRTVAKPLLHLGDNEEGRTTAGSAIRTGQAAIGRHILTDPQVLPRWREEARRRGYASVSSFPLFIDGQVIGNLTVFAAEPDAFDTDEVELLSELASDLTYGIKALRANLERARGGAAQAHRPRLENAKRRQSHGAAGDGGAATAAGHVPRHRGRRWLSHGLDRLCRERRGEDDPPRGLRRVRGRTGTGAAIQLGGYRPGEHGNGDGHPQRPTVHRPKAAQRPQCRTGVARGGAAARLRLGERVSAVRRRHHPGQSDHLCDRGRRLRRGRRKTAG